MYGIARAACLVAVLGCGDARPVETSTPWCPSWKPEVSQAFTQSCASCHSGDDAAGGYDVTSYSSAIADPARQSLATVLDPATADATHRPFTSLDPMVSAWAGDCDFSYVRSSIHPPGIQDPTSDDFHGKEVARQGFQLETCGSCHGNDFRGGAAGSDCTSCHTEPGGPAACNTCHGTPPSSGAHIAHTTSPRLDKPQSCSSCHVVPSVYTDTGHVTTAAGEPDPSPAEVTFAAGGTFDPSTMTCSSVYCHDGSGAQFPRPVWNGGPTQGDCGACHGTPPPAGHPPNSQCASCHLAAHPAEHLNGKIELGDPALGCNGCHNNAERPLGGAHRGHVEAIHNLTEPLACNECHVVPATVTAAGHLDSPAPAEVTFGALARTPPADPRIEGGTCSGTYCHGTATVDWTASGGAATCGSCHGVPPLDGDHAPTLRVTDCVTCHPATVDGGGNIRFTNGATTHINGRPDVAAP